MVFGVDSSQRLGSSTPEGEVTGRVDSPECEAERREKGMRKQLRMKSMKGENELMDEEGELIDERKK